MIALTAALLIVGPNVANAVSWTPLDFPGAERTVALGIDGSNVVGSFSKADGDDCPSVGCGFLFNGSDWTVLAFPAALNTWASGIDGNRIAGSYLDSNSRIHGFIYESGDWNSFDYPEASETLVHDIDGNYIVGTYDSGKGFVFDGNLWTTLDFPNAFHIFPVGVDDGRILANYITINADWGNFIFDGTTYEILNDESEITTYYLGLDGSRVVGERGVAGSVRGLLLDGSIWQEFQFGNYSHTRFTDVDGDRIVGWYLRDDYSSGAFIVQIPEPISIALVCPAFMSLIAIQRRLWT